MIKKMDVITERICEPGYFDYSDTEAVLLSIHLDIRDIQLKINEIIERVNKQ